MANVAAVSLAIGYPTAASVPHSIVNGFKVCTLCKERHSDMLTNFLLESVGCGCSNRHHLQGG